MDDVKVLTTLKILIIGESNVGKSRWEWRVYNAFFRNYNIFFVFLLRLVYFYVSSMTNSIQNNRLRLVSISRRKFSMSTAIMLN